MLPETWKSARGELEKIALARWQKEFSSLPHEDAARLPLGSTYAAMKENPSRELNQLENLKERQGHLRDMREKLVAPAPVAPEQVAQKRQMAGKLFTAQSKLETPMAGMGPVNITNPSGVAHTRAIPGDKPMVMVGEDIGAVIREGLSSEQKKPGLMERITAPYKQQAILQGVVKPAPIPTEAVDSTLAHSALRHELGEASASLTGKGAVHASHSSIRPILEENIALMGDPEAQKIMGGFRKHHPEDVMVSKRLRQMGAIPNAPIPIGGRQEARLNRWMAGMGPKLSPETRAAAVQHAFQGVTAPYLPVELHGGVPNVASAVQYLGNFATDPEKAKAELRQQGVGGVLRGVGRGVKKLWRARKFLNTGK